MSTVLVAVFSLLGILAGKILFKKWMNHLTSYSFIFGGLIFLYELKLLPYPDIIPLAWFFLIASSFSFLLGILTIIVARNLNPENNLSLKNNKIYLPFLADDGKILKYSIFFFSCIALFVAVQRWWVLINMFGSIPAVLLNAGIVYRLNVHREIKEFIPILPAFVYVAVFLSGIYAAYKGKFTFLTMFPFICIILKELTYFGRAELLLTLIEFFFSFFFFRHLLNDREVKIPFSKKNAVIVSTFLLILVISVASFIRASRGNYENYLGASKELKSLKSNIIITPSVYLYLSSDVGVFSKYIEQGGEDVMFGENTFFIGHVFLSTIGLRDRPEFFPRGYYIPMWTNTGTYLRELHADFGFAGLFIGPYLIGLLITWLWFKFYKEGNIITFAFLVYLNLIIGFSFLTMVTKLNQWYISLLFILIYLPFLNKMAARNG